MSARLWHTITIVGWTAIAHCAPRLINDLSQWSSEVIPIQQVVGPRSILYASLVVHTALKGQVDPLFFVGAHPCGTSHVPPFGVCRSATPYVQGWDVLTLVRTWVLQVGVTSPQLGDLQLPSHFLKEGAQVWDRSWDHVVMEPKRYSMSHLAMSGSVCLKLLYNLLDRDRSAWCSLPA